MKTYYQDEAVDDPDWAATGDMPDAERCVRVQTGDSLLCKFELRSAPGKVAYGEGAADLSPVFITTDSSGPQAKRSVDWSPYAAIGCDERKVVRFDNLPAGLVTIRIWNLDPDSQPLVALQMEVIPRV